MIPVFVKRKGWVISIIYLFLLLLINRQPPMYATEKTSHTSPKIEEIVVKYDSNYYAKIVWLCIAALTTIQLTRISIKKLLYFFYEKQDFSMLIIGILLNLPTLISLGLFFNALLTPKMLIKGYKGPNGTYHLTIGKNNYIPLANIRYAAIITNPNETETKQLHFYVKKPAGVYMLECQRINSNTLRNLINFLKAKNVDIIEAN